MSDTLTIITQHDIKINKKIKIYCIYIWPKALKVLYFQGCRLNIVYNLTNEMHFYGKVKIKNISLNFYTG